MTSRRNMKTGRSRDQERDNKFEFQPEPVKTTRVYARDEISCMTDRQLLEALDLVDKKIHLTRRQRESTIDLETEHCYLEDTRQRRSKWSKSLRFRNDSSYTGRRQKGYNYER